MDRGAISKLFISLLYEIKKLYTLRMDELAIDDKKYISTKRAAEITGYAKDYVGQLCREGRVEARLVGRSWYVLDSAINEHRFGKEAQEEIKVPEEPKEDPYRSWQSPKYVSEMPYRLPVLKDRPMGSTLNLLRKDSDTNHSDISSNQAVFPKDHIVEGETLASEEHPIEETYSAVVRENERAETEVPLHKLPAKASGAHFDVQNASKSEPKHLKKPIQAPVERRKVAPAILIAFAILSIAVMLIGTGAADTYLPESEIINFLGGKETYIKQ